MGEVDDLSVCTDYQLFCTRFHESAKADDDSRINDVDYPFEVANANRNKFLSVFSLKCFRSHVLPFGIEEGERAEVE